MLSLKMTPLLNAVIGNALCVGACVFRNTGRNFGSINLEFVSYTLENSEHQGSL